MNRFKILLLNSLSAIHWEPQAKTRYQDAKNLICVSVAENTALAAKESHDYSLETSK